MTRALTKPLIIVVNLFFMKPEVAQKILPSLTKKNYPNFLKWVSSPQPMFGDTTLPAELFPSAEQVEKMTETEFGNFVHNMNKTAHEIGMKKDFEEYMTDLRKKEAKYKHDLKIKELGAGKENAKLKGDKENAKLKKDLLDRVQSLNTKIYDLQAGVDIYTPDPKKEAAIEGAIKERDKLAERYVKLGGDREDLGLDEPQKAQETGADTDAKNWLKNRMSRGKLKSGSEIPEYKHDRKQKIH